MTRLPPHSVDVILRVRGIVQGVGFRPFVHRTASQLDLRGWVRNDPQGVLIRAVGPGDRVESLIHALRASPPPASHVLSVTREESGSAAAAPADEFLIIASENTGDIEAGVPPDLALCSECRAELLDAANRRHLYPFINCTQCGPRYSIIEQLPYDRPHTTMRAFRLCPSCQSEYDSPTDRRFHAQPNACPACGPAVILSSADGAELASAATAIEQAADRLRRGEAIAVKGVGGYHLFVDATNEAAVAELRRRKHRDEKPFAVMFRTLAAVARFAEVSDEASKALVSPAAPIVLLPRLPRTSLAASVAPGNPWLGALLAYSPLHVLLLQKLEHPVVATSANLAEEPLCTDPTEAHQRLARMADAFLDHNRPIAHPVDDSVLRIAGSGPVLLRRARGFAPMPLQLPARLEGHWLCVGGQMKNTIAVASGDRLVLSPHIGDLNGASTLSVFRKTADMLGALHGATFTGVVRDKHPDYASTRYATSLGLPGTAVQHHLAHVLACLLEHQHPADGVLGVAWDGTGYGEDGTIWGGEFLLLRNHRAHRFARLRPFRLAGGEAAVRDPRRVALALLHEANDQRFMAIAHELGFSTDDGLVLRIMLTRGLNSPMTSSAGRLFDAVGALLHLGRHNHFEGQTPLAVEAAAASAGSTGPVLPLSIRSLPNGAGANLELDWRPLLEALLDQRKRDTPAPVLAASFHRALARAITDVARIADVNTIALTGGCFQNTLLLDLTTRELRDAGFTVLTHRALPPNDGNLAAGQALGALWNLTSVELP